MLAYWMTSDPEKMQQWIDDDRPFWGRRNLPFLVSSHILKDRELLRRHIAFFYQGWSRRYSDYGI